MRGGVLACGSRIQIPTPWRLAYQVGATAQGGRWRSRVRLRDHAGTPGTSPFCPLLTPHKAGSSIYGYGDFDGPVFRPSAGEFGRYGGRASLPFGATLRASPAGAGEGCSAPFDPPETCAAAEFAVGARAPSPVAARPDGRPPHHHRRRPSSPTGGAKAAAAGV